MRKLLVVLAVVAATASACGGSGSGSLGGNAIAKAVDASSGQKADVQQGSDGATVKTDDGSITFGANGDSIDITGTDAQGNDFSVSGGTEVPADFPLPVPDNVEISSATTFDMPEGRSFGLIFDFDGSRAAEITKLYRDTLNAQGLSVQDSGGDDGAVIVGSSDVLNVIVSINNFGDYWEASLSWTPA